LSYIPISDESATRNLLVFGGSQGARVFNAVLPKIAKKLLDHIPGLYILHQAGAGADEKTRAAYVASGADPKRWKVSAYLNDMPERFADADLILCRSGASTVAELAAAGRASVLVPFPGAADDHQMKNAEALARVGATNLRIQDDDALMESFLFSDLSGLLLADDHRALMAEKVRSFARPDALVQIGDMIVDLAKR
jgi:UDP-N-acetylglucosamine--N-acetylmuramyl-(pentapeptide) pyrophosphoryl-undecaprenol N-acetylglucosamine transferase